MTVQEWPLVDFPTVVEPPVRCCQRSDCSTVVAGGPADVRLRAPYEGHRSANRKAAIQGTKAVAKKLWAESYQALAEAAIDAELAATAPAGAADGYCADTIRERNFALFEKQCEDEAEKSVQQLNLGTKSVAKLRACTRCWSVSYCSRTCQSDDWAAHKVWCKQRPKAKKAVATSEGSKEVLPA
eukprot:SAG22_NODE_15_length_32914_cov_20.713546_2_plen_184_part_00